MPPPSTFGTRLRAARKAAQQSAQVTAGRVGVSFETLRRWERDQGEPKASQVVRLSIVLRVAPSDLLEPTPDPEAA